MYCKKCIYIWARTKAANRAQPTCPTCTKPFRLADLVKVSMDGVWNSDALQRRIVAAEALQRSMAAEALSA